MKRKIRRLFNWLSLRLLGSMPCHEIAVRQPVCIKVCLLVDANRNGMYEQIEWTITDETHPWLRDGQRVHMAIDIWEGADTSKSLSAQADLIPDRCRNPLPSSLVCPSGGVSSSLHK